MQADPIMEREIEAYLDDALDLESRLAVETFLAKNPEKAAKFMGQRRADTALRLLGATPWAPARSFHVAAAELARRLQSGQSRRRGGHESLRAIAAASGAVLLAVTGLLAIESTGQAEPPSYVADAVMSYRTGLLRAAMDSQPESLLFDADEIQRNTKIRVPRLPAGWTVTDVQIFPSDAGPALQIMIRTAEMKSISIFAVQSVSAAPVSPTAIRHGDAAVAYWRKGSTSYALTGMGAPEALDLAAEDLALNGPS